MHASTGGTAGANNAEFAGNSAAGQSNKAGAAGQDSKAGAAGQAAAGTSGTAGGSAGNGAAGAEEGGASGQGGAGAAGEGGTSGAAGTEAGGSGGGTGGSGTGGAGGKSLCGGEFPQVDKTCTSKQDCTWGMHTANCCGSMIAVGFNKNYTTKFSENEQAWAACLPGCGCASDPTVTEDGKQIGQGTADVACNAGQCQTFTTSEQPKGCCPAFGCPSGTQCAGGLKCEPPVQPGQCWADGDCADGATCEGANMCPCDALCDVADSPGVCKKNGLAANECRGQADCSSPDLTCAPPGTPVGCGICQLPENPCSSDDECKAQDPTTICDIPSPCVCDTVCIPGCKSDADCGEGEACGANLRCGPKPCKETTECSSNFACQGGTCQRKTCKSDDGCSGNYCVLGACFSSAGQCMGPPPP